LYQFGVTAGWRRRGLGRALLTHALDRVNPSSDDDTSVRVNAANRPAVELVHAVGFEIDGRDDYFVEPRPK
jgi:ribosomal protein S18 acetylase RimI-like enzyme